MLELIAIVTVSAVKSWNLKTGSGKGQMEYGMMIVMTVEGEKEEGGGGEDGEE